MKSDWNHYLGKLYHIDDKYLKDWDMWADNIGAPWNTDYDSKDFPVIVDKNYRTLFEQVGADEDQAVFCADAPLVIKSLVAEVRRLREALAQSQRYNTPEPEEVQGRCGHECAGCRADRLEAQSEDRWRLDRDDQRLKQHSADKEEK